MCINNFCVFNLLWFGFWRRVIKTQENTAGRLAPIVEERAAELAYFFRENYQASLLSRGELQQLQLGLRPGIVL